MRLTPGNPAERYLATKRLSASPLISFPFDLATERRFWKRHLRWKDKQRRNHDDTKPSSIVQGSMDEGSSDFSPISCDTAVQSTTAASPPTLSKTILILPEDIFFHIFHHTIGPSPDLASIHDLRSRSSSSSHLFALMTLSYVCRAWRYMITTSMPTAWSTIIVREPHKTAVVHLVELWLIRSGPICPLSLSIDQGLLCFSSELQPLNDILKLYVSHIDRWKVIALRLTGILAAYDQVLSILTTPPKGLVKVAWMRLEGLESWPQLLSEGSDDAEKDVRERIWKILNASKHLKSVRWYKYISLSTPWTQIEDIHLLSDDVRPVMRVLSRLVNLKTLYAAGLSCVDDPGPPSLLPKQENALIESPSLHSIHLQGHQSAILLDRIVAPALKHLRVEPPAVKWRNTLPNISRLLENTPDCQLATLVIANLEQFPMTLSLFDFFCRWRERLVGLVELEIGPKMITSDVMRLLTVPGHASEDGLDLRRGPSVDARGYLPSLRSLSINHYRAFDKGHLGEMVQSRFRYGSLQSVFVRIDGKYACDLDSAILGSLKAEGRDVKWEIV